MSLVEQEVIAPAEVTVREVLHRAADLLEEFGWAQHACNISFAKPGPFCIGVAISVGALDLGTTAREMYMNGVDFNLYLSFEQDTMVEWNDEPGRTKAEVVARLRAAAEAAA